MNSTYSYKIFSCGDSAVTVDFGNVIDEDINVYVLQLFHHLTQKNIDGVKDVIPAYSSITVVYDVFAIHAMEKCTTAYNFMQQTLQGILCEELINMPTTGRLIKIPACYREAFAPDIIEIAALRNLSVDELINLHCSKTYRVYMLGFLPGFAYMGIVDEKVATPRKNTPRTKVPAGSIGIAGSQTGIYPFESPGGWNIIAQTPLTLFDAGTPRPALLQAGDTVQFYPVTITEFNNIKAAQ